MNYNNVAELNNLILEEAYYLFTEFKMSVQINDGHVIDLQKEDD